MTLVYSSRSTNRVSYPIEDRRRFQKNRQRVLGTPYERYFDGDLWLHSGVLPAITAPMEPTLALAPNSAGLGSLLEAGYHAVENGYCELPDGSAYVASLVPFPGCTGAMLQWWCWWRAAGPMRYSLAHPYEHIAARPVDRAVLTAPGLTHEQRYVGSTFDIDECIGAESIPVAVSFVEPAEFGFDTGRFAAAGIVAQACTRVSLRWPRFEAASTVHLARKTENGFELRSRYWIGGDPRFQALRASVAERGTTLAPARRIAGNRLAYEQLLHDQVEFTHLSTFLARLYSEFGPQS